MDRYRRKYTEMDEKMFHVRRYLMARHYGQGNAARREEVRQGVLQSWGPGTLVLSDRDFRALLVELLHEGVPVCTTPQDGVYIATSREEALHAIRYWRTAGNSMIQRANLLDTITFERQPTLF